MKLFRNDSYVFKYNIGYVSLACKIGYNIGYVSLDM